MRLIFEEKLPMPQIQNAQKVREVAKDLGVDPNWMMVVMNFETGGTFSPKVVNPTGGATGLIQFMPATARDLGTTVTELANMTFIEQMDFVKKYYLRTGVMRRVVSATDLYLATFFPAAVGKPSSFILQTANLSASLIARQNPVFDLNKDGQITKGEIEEFMNRYNPLNEKKNLNLTKPGGFLTIAGLGILAFIGIKYLK